MRSIFFIIAASSLLALRNVSANQDYVNEMPDDICAQMANEGKCETESKIMGGACAKACNDRMMAQVQEMAKTQMGQKANKVNSLDDAICAQMANDGKCKTQPKIALEFCAKACHELEMSKAYYQTIELDDEDDEPFFDLRAKNWTGSSLNFNGFDGYITSVINIGITCEPGEGELLASRIDQFRKVMPNTLELLVFPFDLTEEQNLKETECASFDHILKTVRKTLHIMELTNINGPNTHPVFKYLKEKFGIDEMSANQSSFFFVNPEGTQIDLLEGQSFSRLKHHVKNHLNKWEEL